MLPWIFIAMEYFHSLYFLPEFRQFFVEIFSKLLSSKNSLKLGVQVQHEIQEFSSNLDAL